jgi:hypothetical protein
VAIPAPLVTSVTDRLTLIPVPASPTAGGEITRRADLRLARAVPAGLDELRLQIDTYGGTPRLAGGTLTITEACAFAAEPDTLRAGGSVIFRSAKACDSIPAGAAATLVLRFGERNIQDARCALVASRADGHAHLLGIEFNGAEYALLGQQTTRRSDATMTRAALLAWMWQRPVGFVWWAVGIAGLLIVAAGALLAWRRGPPAAAGLAALAAGLGLAYAILVPPLQAPDEPNHLLGYAIAVGNNRLPAQTAEWAKALHFERITFHSEEHFRPYDVTQPSAVAWGPHVTPADENSRGPLTVRYWRLLARSMEGAGPSATLLRLRVTNAFLFGAIAGLACLLVSISRQGATTHLIALALLLVPTLPFFAMHVSNYALLVDGYVLLAVGVGALCHGRTDSAGVGFLLGSGTSVALATSVSALPMLAVVAAAMLAAVAGRSIEAPARPRYWFWGMFVLGAVAISVAPAGADPLTKAGVYQGSAFSLLSGWRWMAIGIGIAGVGLDRLAAAVWRTPRAGAGVVTARGLQLLAALIALAALASLAFPYPVLQLMETRDQWPKPAEYVWDVFRSAVTLGRISYPDGLLSSSFWAKFGWLDTYPGDWLTNLLTGAVVAALVALLLATARARDNRKAVRLLLVGCGAAAALAIYAVGASVQRTNLHGRYLFGLYLCGVAICWSVLAVAGASGERRQQAATTFLFTAIASVHAVCLVVVLRRYF